MQAGDDLEDHLLMARFIWLRVMGDLSGRHVIEFLNYSKGVCITKRIQSGRPEYVLYMNPR